MKDTTKTANRLINEKSPYLLQHAHNPVDWYPWGEEAFEKAKKEDKPVFLSIGYSTCHWCHVMERESFEDQEVAEILNKNYISIKVDREERPDIDTIYMSVCQTMTGHGGWPLTVIMAPDKKPFFAGTYFPKQDNRGMPGLIRILQQAVHQWNLDREILLTSSDEIAHVVNESMFSHAKGEIHEDILHKAYTYFSASFDPKYGGFGRAPKFPTPHNLMFLLRYYKMTEEKKALEMVEKTLDSMYLGGIFDHIGFGFARYSTDNRWLVPHFEKMLYDNALLAITYLEAYQATHNEQYATIAQEIFTYVLRDMTSPEGAFYSAEDADSEGEEGKFYVWTPKEVQEVLGEKEGQEFCKAFDITEEGNFERKNIPNLILTGYTDQFNEAKKLLFQHREKRVHPFKDDKVLTAWNGLMIAALARGSRVLGDEKLGESAKKAVEFIRHNLFDTDGRLLARYRNGESGVPAFLDDYAFFIWGLLELHQAGFGHSYFSLAMTLEGYMTKYFYDEENGGYFFSAEDAENLLARPKEVYDGAMPSGNSVVALVFQELLALTSDPEFEGKAKTQLRAFAGSVEEMPAAHSFFLLAAYMDIQGYAKISISGPTDYDQTLSLIREANGLFVPEAVLAINDSSETNACADAQAVVCRNFECSQPVSTPEELHALMMARPSDN